MTIDIDAIRQREQAADSGPWRVVEEHGRDIADEAYSRITIQTAIRYGESCEIAELVDPDHDWASKLAEENAEFIAHARQDIPALLAELDKVRAQLADTQHRAHTDATNLQQILRDKTALANERDAMRKVVEAAKVWREWYGNTNPSYASACNDLAAAVDAMTESEVAR